MSQWSGGLREGSTVAEREYLKNANAGEDVSGLLHEIHRQKESKNSREFRLKEQALAIVKKYQSKSMSSFKRPPRVLLRQGGEEAAMKDWKNQESGESLHKRLEQRREQERREMQAMRRKLEQREKSRKDAARQRSRNATIRVSIAARFSCRGAAAGPGLYPGVSAWMVLSRCLGGAVPPPLQPPPGSPDMKPTPTNARAGLLPTLMLVEAREEVFGILTQGHAGQVETHVFPASPLVLEWLDASFKAWSYAASQGARRGFDQHVPFVVGRFPSSKLPSTRGRGDAIVSTESQLFKSCSAALAHARRHQAQARNQGPPSPQRKTPHKRPRSPEAMGNDPSCVYVPQELMSHALSPADASAQGVWSGRAIACIQPFLVPKLSPWLVRVVVSIDRSEKTAPGARSTKRPQSASAAKKRAKGRQRAPRVRFVLESGMFAAPASRTHREKETEEKQASSSQRNRSSGGRVSARSASSDAAARGNDASRWSENWAVHVSPDGSGIYALPLSLHVVETELGALYRVKESAWPVSHQFNPAHRPANTFHPSLLTVPPEDAAWMQQVDEDVPCLLKHPESSEWALQSSIGAEHSTKPLLPQERASLWILDALQDWSGQGVSRCACDWLYSSECGWLLSGIAALEVEEAQAQGLYQGTAWHSAKQALASPSVAKKYKRSWSARSPQRASRSTQPGLARTARGTGPSLRHSHTATDMAVQDVFGEGGSSSSRGLQRKGSGAMPRLPPLRASQSRTNSLTTPDAAPGRMGRMLGLLGSKSEELPLWREEEEEGLHWWREPPQPRGKERDTGEINNNNTNNNAISAAGPRSPSPLRSPPRRQPVASVLQQRIPPSVDATTLREKYTQLSEVMERVLGDGEKKHGKKRTATTTLRRRDPASTRSTREPARAPEVGQGQEKADVVDASTVPLHADAHPLPPAATNSITSRLQHNPFAMELLRRTEGRSAESLLLPRHSSPPAATNPEGEDDEEVLSRILGLKPKHVSPSSKRRPAASVASPTKETAAKTNDPQAESGFPKVDPMNVYDIMLQSANQRHQSKLEEVKKQLYSQYGGAGAPKTGSAMQEGSTDSQDWLIGSSESTVEVYPGVTGWPSASTSTQADSAQSDAASHDSGIHIGKRSVKRISRKQQRIVERLSRPSRQVPAQESVEEEGSTATVSSSTAEAVADVLRQARSIYSTKMTKHTHKPGHIPASPAPCARGVETGKVEVSSANALLRRRPDPLDPHAPPKVGTDDLPKVKKPEAVLKAKPRVQSFASLPKRKGKRKKKKQKAAATTQPADEAEDNRGDEEHRASRPLSPITSPTKAQPRDKSKEVEVQYENSSEAEKHEEEKEEDNLDDRSQGEAPSADGESMEESSDEDEEEDEEVPSMFQSKLQARMRRQLHLDIDQVHSTARPPTPAEETGDPPRIVMHSPQSPISEAPSLLSAQTPERSHASQSKFAHLYLSPTSPSIASSAGSGYFPKQLRSAVS